METRAPGQSFKLLQFDKPLVIASYFGFTPITAPKLTPDDAEVVSHCRKLPYYDALDKAALLRTYIERDFASMPHPLALIYKSKKPLTYTLHYIGSPSGIAEAALIRTALSILTDQGWKNLRLELNSIGDKDSLTFYERELLQYVKKFGTSLSEKARLILKEDAFNLFHSDDEELKRLSTSAPASLSYLSPQSRAHFKEVLEFIEGLGIEFDISPALVGEKNHSSHTIFGIRAAGARDLLATGYHYSRLSKRVGLEKEFPLVSISIFLGDKGKTRVYKELPKPKFYLVQLGREAKIRTLGLLEELRQQHICVQHFLGKDKLSAQLPDADALSASHLIIIGHKEALDGTATVRNVSTRAQDTIPLILLPQYLKKINL